MATNPQPIGRIKERRILTYDVGFNNNTLLVRVDLTVGNDPATPIPSLYQARLQPFFKIPKRPVNLGLREITVCFIGDSTRTIYNPYRNNTLEHNQLIRELYNYSTDIVDLSYRGESWATLLT